MKRIIYFAIFISLLICFVGNVNALTYKATVTEKAGINVRKGPGTSHGIAGSLNYKATVTLVSTTKSKGTGCSAGWYKVNYGGSTSRYICSSYVSVSSSGSSNPVINSSNYYTTKTWSARVNENNINIRKGPSTSYGIMDTVYLGTELEIIENSNSSWYKVKYYNNKVGYISKSLVDVYGSVTASDTAYAKTLKSAGFPDSYIPYLTYLHKKYPNWKFSAVQTNKYFNTAISKEIGKNYIQSTFNTYRDSAKVKEYGSGGRNWYNASSGVVAFYLDPRTYLNEKNIFVFEKLSYDAKSQTYDIISTIFKGSYLNTKTNINYFLSAGKTYDISPVHLASRVRQEGGTSASYAGVSGTVTTKWSGKSLKGFYNYYNIGAYGDNPVIRGLAVAAGYVGNADGTPWNTREKAIKYGAKIIAEDYINVGQNTLYFQKFNTGNNTTYSAYTHQYMTNVTAPTSEANSAYEAYSDAKVLSKTLTFSIPVYKDMPSNATTLPPIKDTNNELSSISIDGIKITGFDKDVLTYVKYISDKTTSVNVGATAVSNKSKVTGTGNIKINSDSTVVNIKVTSEAGTVKTYKLNLTRVKSGSSSRLSFEQIIDKMDVKYSNSYLTGIKNGTSLATFTNMVNKIEPSAKVKLYSSKGTAKTGNLVTGDSISITTNNVTKKIVVSIKGDVNGDGKVSAIDLFRIQKHILKQSSLSGAYKEASDANGDGKISAIDLFKIQKSILGKDTLK